MNEYKLSLSYMFHNCKKKKKKTAIFNVVLLYTIM